MTARSLGRTYMVDGDTLERSYREILSGYMSWGQRDHAKEWVLLDENMGEHLSIDETSFHGDLYTFLSNKSGHGRRGSIVAVRKGVRPADMVAVLTRIPQEKRLKVKEVTMDLSDNMAVMVRTAFPKATITRDCFHVVKRGGDGVEEVRLRCKREAVAELKREVAAQIKRKPPHLPDAGPRTARSTPSGTRARSAARSRRAGTAPTSPRLCHAARRRWRC